MTDPFPEPPDLRQIAESLRRNRRRILLLLPVVIIALAATSISYSIAPDEEGVVLRFGRFVEITQPGLHARLPFGIDQVYKVRTRRIHKVEFGFRSEESGVQTRYSRNEFGDEALMLTGDLNVADVQWIVQYKISDAKAYLFNVRDVAKNIRDIAEASMRLVVGDRSVTDVLTVGRTEIASDVERVMQQSLDKYGMGIRIVTVKLQDVNPPNPVRPSFNDVNAAKQEQERVINEARRAYNKAIPNAQGEAQKMIAEAEGYALERVNRARGDGERFEEVFRAYRRAPDITRARLYLEAMEEVYQKVDRVVVADPAVRSMVPFLNLDGMKKSAKEKGE